MNIQTFNTMNLIPIGRVRFTFSKNFRRNSETQYIHVNDLHILCETDRFISPETEKAVMKMMKTAKSDLLTDGRDFYTTRGNKITQIKHGSFHSILSMHKDEIHELLYK